MPLSLRLRTNSWTRILALELKAKDGFTLADYRDKDGGAALAVSISIDVSIEFRRQ